MLHISLCSLCSVVSSAVRAAFIIRGIQFSILKLSVCLALFAYVYIVVGPCECVIMLGPSSLYVIGDMNASVAAVIESRVIDIRHMLIMLRTVCRSVCLMILSMRMIG